MDRISFHGGIDGIGGNKILVETPGARFFLDHGESFSFGKDFFVGWLAARESRTGLKDYFALDLMPRIPGLYSRKMLEQTSFPYQEPAFDAIFLSHVHYDHLAHLRFVDEQIPVYLGVTTKRMLDSWQETSIKVNFGEHPYTTFKTGDVVRVGDCEVEPVHVDHSVPAAYGLIVHAPGGAIVYTGDLRLHGPMARMTRDFIDRAKAAEPVAMICEGTRVAPVQTRKDTSEQEVLDGAIQLVSKTSNLVLVSFYNRDIDRIKTYYEVARATGRKLVLSMEVAHLLYQLTPDPGIIVPDPFNDPDILVYERKLSRYPKWQKEILEGKCGGSPVCIVDAGYIHDNQEKLIVHLDFTRFTEIIDMNPAPGSLYINSISEPFVENDIEDRVKDNWLDHFGIRREQLHASGHCKMQEIFDIVNEIAPKVVFPVHTEHPGLFEGNVDAKVIVPEAGKEYET